MLAYATTSTAPSEEVWELMAQPAQWHRWAPHVRGAIGLGQPEVTRGRAGFVRLAPALLVPVKVIDKRAHRRWDWQVGPVKIRHAVAPRGSGSEVRMEIRAPLALEVAIGALYGPLVRLLAGNLARVAASPPS